MKLYAHPGLSLPPIDAVFKFVSPEVADWLSRSQWERDWPYNDNFRDQQPVDEYAKVFQAESPLYAGEAHAVIGGWHLVWPDGDRAQLLDRTLILTTFADSEPWVEVWETSRGVEVIPRIT